jgi:hypothetical protein
MQKKYSAKITGNPFLYLELKEVAKLKSAGINDQDIKKIVIENNLFQYKTIKSVAKRLGAVIERLEILDDELIQMLVNSSNETGRLVALYSIMKTDFMFFEFMQEVVCERYKSLQPQLNKAVIQNFLDIKAEQSERVSNFTDATITKLKQVYIKVLIEAGYIKDKVKLEIEPLIIGSRLSEHLKAIGDREYLNAMLGG